MGDAQSLSDYKIVLYTQDGGRDWVAEVPAVPGCYALMQSRDEALRELERVFEMIREEYAETGKRLPADSTELLTRAERDARIPACRQPTRVFTELNDGKP